MDSEGTPATDGVAVQWADDATGLNHKIKQYFDGVATLDEALYTIEGHVCKATYCQDGGYKGGYPVGSTTDNYSTFTITMAARS